jgi:hypothetical protein
LYDAGADVVINGHDHHYERFAPQNPIGGADAKGIREFIAGTGGANLRPPTSTITNSVVMNGTTNGVLKLTLHATSYDWQFVPVAGSTFQDSGSAACVTTGQQATATRTPTVTRTPVPTRTPMPTRTPAPTAIVTNYLLNWSFEADAPPLDGKPDSWTLSPAFTRSSEIPAHNGSYVGRLSDTGNLNYTIGQTILNLSPGVTYPFSGWVNIPPQNDSSFTCRLQVRWLAADNSVIGDVTVASYTAPTAGWVKAALSPVAPAETNKARVQVVASSLNGTIYVDQFVFRP